MLSFLLSCSATVNSVTLGGNSLGLVEVLATERAETTITVDERTFPDANLRRALLTENPMGNTIHKYQFEQSNGQPPIFADVKDFTGMETIPREFWEHIKGDDSRVLHFKGQLPDNFNDFYELYKHDELMQDYFRNLRVDTSNATSLIRVIEILNELDDMGVDVGLRLYVYNQASLDALKELNSSIIIERLHIDAIDITDFSGLNNIKAKYIDFMKPRDYSGSPPTRKLNLEGIVLPETEELSLSTLDNYSFDFGKSDLSINLPKVKSVGHIFRGVPTQAILDDLLDSYQATIILPADAESVRRFVSLDFAKQTKPLNIRYELDPNVDYKELNDILIDAGLNVQVDLHKMPGQTTTEHDLTKVFGDSSISKLTGFTGASSDTNTVDTIKSTKRIDYGSRYYATCNFTFGDTVFKMSTDKLDDGLEYLCIQTIVNGEVVETDFRYDKQWNVDRSYWEANGSNLSKYYVKYLDTSTLKVSFNNEELVSGSKSFNCSLDNKTTSGAYLNTINVEMGKNTIRYKFNTNGGNSIEDKTVEYLGDMGTEPRPTKAGHRFVGWYTDAALTDRYYWSDTNREIINTNKNKTIPLYAKYEVGSEVIKPKFVSASIGGLLPEKQIRVDLDTSLVTNISSLDKANFTITADGVPVSIVDVQGNMGSSSITVLIGDTLYKGQDIKITYNGDKVESFTNETVINNIVTEKPGVVKPSIVSAVVENATNNRIDLNLSDTLTGDITSVGDWEVKVTDSVVSITNVQGSGNRVQIGLQNSISYGDTVKVTYKGSVLTQVSDYNVINNVQSGVVVKPSYVASNLKDKNTVTIHLDDVVSSNITNDISSFSVKVNGRPVGINAINNSGSLVELTLNTNVIGKDNVTVSYMGEYINHFSDKIVVNNLDEAAKCLYITVNKDAKDIIKLVLDKELQDKVTLGDLSDFTINKNGSNLTVGDIANITTVGSVINIELNDELVAQDNLKISYTGVKLEQFSEKVVVNNIRPAILNGSINDNARDVINISLDEGLLTDLSVANKGDFKVYVDGNLVGVSDVKGTVGSTSIQITLEDVVYANQVVELTYTGKDLIEVLNVGIKNNIKEELPKLNVVDAYVQGGYTSDRVTVLFNSNLQGTRSNSYKDIVKVSVNNVDTEVLDTHATGNQLTLTVDDILNYKDNIAITIVDNTSIGNVDDYVTQNRLFKVGGFDVDDNGNIIVKPGVVIRPSKPTVPPIVDNGNGTVTLPGGVVDSDNNNNDIDIKDDITLKPGDGGISTDNGITVDDDNIKLPDGSVIEPGDGGAIIGGGVITLPGGGTLTKPDGSDNTLGNGSIIDTGSGDSNSGSTSGSNGGNFSGGGAVIGKPSTPSDSGNKTDGNESNNGDTTNNGDNTNSGDTWYENVIDTLVERGIITRGEFAKLIVDLLEKEYGTTLSLSNTVYSDINSSIETHKALLQLNSVDIFLGYNNGLMRPDGYITREVMAIVVYKLANYLGVESQGSFDMFKDIDEASRWSKEYIIKLQDYGIISGNEDNNFEPKKLFNKVEAYVVIYKLLK